MKFNLTTFSSTALIAAMALGLSAPVDAKKIRASGQKSINHNTNINRNINRNTNINVNQRHNTNVNVNVNTGYNHGCCYHSNYHPMGTVAAVAVTAMVVGSIVSSLPPDCNTVIVNGFSYRQCGNTWYQPQISGSSTTYIVVNSPPGY